MQKLNLIFDLDNTCICILKHNKKKKIQLIDEIINSNEYKQNINRLQERIKTFTLIDANYNMSHPGDGKIVKCHIIARPGLLEAIDFLEKNVNSNSIWSAGFPKYVHNIKDAFFPNNYKMTVFTHINTDFKNKDDRIITTKDLTKIFPFIEGSNFKNTLIIDDNKDTAALNMDNVIFCPEYLPKTLEDCLEDDNFFPKFIDFIKNLEPFSDIRLVDKKKFEKKRN